MNSYSEYDYVGRAHCCTPPTDVLCALYRWSARRVLTIAAVYVFALQGLGPNTVKFTYDGERIDEDATPQKVCGGVDVTTGVDRTITRCRGHSL